MPATRERLAAVELELRVPIVPATRERLAAVELELRVPISREWRKPLAQHDLWWIRARAESGPGR